MPQLQIETLDKEKPIILFAGKDNPLLNILIDKFSDEFKIAYVSDENIPGAEDFYRIDTKSAYLINNLEEKLDYAVIYPQEGRERNYLQHIFKKLIEDNTRTVVIINANQVEQFLDIPLEYKRNPNFYFLIYGEAYSEKRNLIPDNDVVRLIKQALVKKSFKISSNDLSPIFPIYLPDAINGISQILLGPAKAQKFYYLFYKTPETYLSAIHILKRIEPDLEVNFSVDSSSESIEQTHKEISQLIETKTGATPVYLDPYFIGFEKSISNFQNIDNEPEEEKSKIEKAAKSIKSSRGKIKLAASAFLIAILVYISTSVILFALGLFTFKAAVDAFERQDYKTAIDYNNNSQIFLNATSPNIRLVIQAVKAAGGAELAAKYDDFTEASALVTLAAQDLGVLRSAAKGLDRTTLDNVLADALYLYFKTQDLKKSLGNERLNGAISPEISKMLALVNVIPDVAGYGQEKNYLLLFQNNGELRPTGGFIGSIGLLKIKDGKIVDLKINDVYDYDGQLKTHVEPPYIVRWYLQPDLYLRDSNFNPDFQTSARVAANLFDQEGGGKVDGVIAINYEAVKQIINAVGPIKLTGYNKTLTGQNAFDFLQETIDNNFFPGSTQKRDVLNALYNALLIKIQDNPNDAAKVIKLIPKLASEKNVLFAFGQNSVQSAFSTAGFGGEYKDTRPASISTISDFLAINEANIGVNKANINVARKTEYKVNLADTITSTVTQTITNAYDKTYAAFIRFYVPEGSDILTVKINGEEQKVVDMPTTKTHEDNRFKPSSNLEVETGSEFGKYFFGFVISVPEKSNQIIEVTYKNGARIPSAPTIDYSLLYIKQPGTSNYPFVLDLDYANNYSAREVKGAHLTPGSIQIKKTINTDEEFNIEFIKK